MLTLNANRTESCQLPHRSDGLAMSFFKGFTDWHRGHKGYSQMSRLSDHELRDIGLSRDELREACYTGRLSK